MKKIGETTSGNVLVRMTRQEWRKIALNLVTPEDLPHLMRRYRHDRRLSQLELSGRLGISQAVLQEVECGHTDNISIRTYRKIIEAICRPAGTERLRPAS